MEFPKGNRAAFFPPSKESVSYWLRGQTGSKARPRQTRDNAGTVLLFEPEHLALGSALLQLNRTALGA
jgi:hypothetical protein